MSLNISYRGSESNLWKEMKSGSREAFDQIYCDNINQLLAYGHEMTSNNQIIEDCIQDLFTDIWIKKENLGNVESIRFYLIISLRRRLLRMIKNQKDLSFADFGQEIQDFDKAVLTVAFEDESYKLKELKKALTKLSSTQKEIIYLKYYAEYSFQEIAQILKMNKKQLYNALAKAMVKLRSIMIRAHVIFPLLIESGNSL